MNKLIIALSLVPCLVCSCHSTKTDWTNRPNSLCAGITQKINRMPTQNAQPGNGVTTTSEQANLLKEYNRLGCHSSSDNEYRNPYESLPINHTANSLPKSNH